MMILNMGVSENRGSPKWMVYNGKTLLKWDDLGVPLFLEIPTWKRNFLFKTSGDSILSNTFGELEV